MNGYLSGSNSYRWDFAVTELSCLVVKGRQVKSSIQNWKQLHSASEAITVGTEKETHTHAQAQIAVPIVYSEEINIICKLWRVFTPCNTRPSAPCWSPSAEQLLYVSSRLQVLANPPILHRALTAYGGEHAWILMRRRNCYWNYILLNRY